MKTSGAACMREDHADLQRRERFIVQRQVRDRPGKVAVRRAVRAPAQVDRAAAHLPATGSIADTTGRSLWMSHAPLRSHLMLCNPMHDAFPAPPVQAALPSKRPHGWAVLQLRVSDSSLQGARPAGRRRQSRGCWCPWSSRYSSAAASAPPAARPHTPGTCT